MRPHTAHALQTASICGSWPTRLGLSHPQLALPDVYCCDVQEVKRYDFCFQQVCRCLQGGRELAPAPTCPHADDHQARHIVS
jgi:hypothetical protein